MKARLRAADSVMDEEDGGEDPLGSDTEDTAIVEDACPSVKLARGPNIARKLAEKADEHWVSHFAFDKDAVVIPDNLHKIKTPGLNRDIWDNVSRQHRKNDKYNLKMQQMLQAVAINTANNADVFVKALRKDRHEESLKNRR